MRFNRGVRIGDHHSRDSWDLVMTKKVIEFPQLQTETVTVPGSDGITDLSTALTGGDIKYKNRKITIDFTMLNEWGQLMKPLAEIADAVHGQALPVVFDEDQGFYYFGRCSMGKPTIDNVIAKFSITVDAEPYKMRNLETLVITPVNGVTIASYVNMRKWVTPRFIVDKELQLTCGKIQATLLPGENVVPGLMFKGGENIVKYSSAELCTVKVVYREGGL